MEEMKEVMKDMSADKEVFFHLYCSACKHVNCADSEDPCDECLASPVNQDSHKPIFFKEKEK